MGIMQGRSSSCHIPESHWLVLHHDIGAIAVGIESNGTTPAGVTWLASWAHGSSMSRRIQYARAARTCRTLRMAEQPW